MAALVWTHTEKSKFINVKRKGSRTAGQVAVQRVSHPTHANEPWRVTVSIGRQTTYHHFANEAEADAYVATLFKGAK